MLICETPDGYTYIERPVTSKILMFITCTAPQEPVWKWNWICKVLDVSPEWLLSGVEVHGDRGNPQKWHVIDSDTDAGKLVVAFNGMNADMQARLLGYAEALLNL